MPFVNQRQIATAEADRLERDAALKFIRDLAVVYPQIVRKDLGVTYLWGARPDPLANYRVKDIHRAAMADETQSDIELLAKLRGVKRGVTVKVEGQSEGIADAVKRGVRKGAAATRGL